MRIDGNLVPLFALAVGLIITVTAILSDTISKHRLKMEQIRADAMVRAEEVRSRNQLELERLMRQDQTGNTAAAGYNPVNNPVNSPVNSPVNNTGNNVVNNGFTMNNETDNNTRSRVRE